MPTTTFAKRIINPVSNASAGGNFPAGNTMLLVDEWADAIEPRETPIYDKVKKGGNVNQIKVQWGQSYNIPLESLLANAMTNVQTTMDMTAGEGAYFGNTSVLRITDYKAGAGATSTNPELDLATSERVYVTAEASTTPTIVRGDFSGTGVAHAAGALVELIGTALPYSTDFQLSPVIRGDQLFNYPQRFQGMVAADKAARNTPDYENKSDVFIADFTRETQKQKYLVDRAILYGYPVTPIPGVSGSEPTFGAQRPGTMGGLDYYITNFSGRVVNLGGQLITMASFESMLYDMYQKVKGGGAMSLLMGAGAIRAIDTFLNQGRMLDANTTKIKLYTDSIEFRWGTLDFTVSQHVKGAAIWFVNWDMIKLKTYKGCDWATYDVPTGGPYDKRAITADFTLEVLSPTSMAKMHNFSLNTTLYPGQYFLGGV